MLHRSSAARPNGFAGRHPSSSVIPHPEQKDLTWTGRGKTPTWVNTWLKQGRVLAELAV